MIRRFASLPLVGGRRCFAATAAAKFAPGDSVCWVDTKVVQHKLNPWEQESKMYVEDHQKSWYKQTFGTVISFDEETNLVKVDFDQNGSGAFATGTWDCDQNMLRKIQYQTIHDV